MNEITTHLVAAHGKLIEALFEVRRRFDAGADDWEHSLLRTMREYMREIGVEGDLIDPLQKMLNAVDDRILKERRAAAGKATNVRSVEDAQSLTFAAACVTTLKARREHADAASTLKAVSRACGIERGELEEFRKNIGRTRKDPSSLKRVPVFQQDIVDGYWTNVRQLKAWGSDEIMEALRRLRTFVK